MRNTRDTTVTSATASPAESTIVLAGDRTRSRALARRHSRRVRWLKFGLPAATLLMLSVYGLAVLNTTGWGSAISELKLPDIVPENLTMENPHYEGFTKDGGRYAVRAETAKQDLKSLNLIRLEKITGELFNAEKQKTALAAARGTYDSKAKLLELHEAIDIAGEGGLTGRFTHAVVQTNENIITSDQPVEIRISAGTITSNKMTVRQKTKEYTFAENVRALLKTRAGASGTSPQPADDTNKLAFGNSTDPIDIASNRLDINDATKDAVFTGQVIANQGQASLTTEELEVSYANTPPSGTPSAVQQSGKVKRVVARSPVVIKQPTGETISGNSADFDAQNQKAVVEGNVVFLAKPDKRATSDRAEIDQVTNIVLLSGNVGISQGANELKGRKLVFNRSNNKMQLTAPAASGGGAAGRITAHFEKSGGAPAAPQKPAGAQQGIALTSTFKTDPGAPVDVEAEHLDLDDGVKQALFTGAVKARQGDFIIRSGELAASYSGSASIGAGGPDAAKQTAAKLTKLQARKSVEVTSHDGQKATGDTADFDTIANTATLGGNVVLTQGKNVVRGTRLVIDMTTGETVIKTEPIAASGPTVSSSDGTGNGTLPKSARPSATFYPNELNAQASKAAGQITGEWTARASP